MIMAPAKLLLETPADILRAKFGHEYAISWSGGFWEG